MDGGVVAGVVAGRYRLVRVVGRGGMGRVWQAHDEILDREVAVKEVMPVAGVAPGRTDIWERTIREARTAGRLKHPNVVRVYDVHFADGRPWIVMEYVEGRSLHAVVRDDGPLDVERAAKVGLALLDGLAAAHAAGVLHRDVTPRNVLLTQDGQTLLGDFGVAVFEEESFRADATREDVLLASPAYVAPERVMAGESSTSTDLWSLGATLYLAVEGRPPYERATPIDQLTALMQEPPDAMRRAGLLEPVIEGLLRRDPGDRLTVAGARPLLEAALTGQRARAPRWRVPVQRRPSPPSDRAGGVGTAAATAISETARRKLVVAGLAVVLLAAGGAGAWAATRPTTGGGPPAVVPSTVQVRYPSPLRCSGATTADAAAQGWVRRDEDGFSTLAPDGWARATDGPVVCFLDPAGRQGFTVDPTPPLDEDRVAYWTEQERVLLAGPDRPAGYRRVTISVALFQRGGADWEYTFDEDGTRWHTLRRNFAIGEGRGFIVSWTAPDAGWDAALDGFRTVTGGFELR
ncbi:serine/threonine-protein kinase [Dactylosporangium sp. NPDC005555]|uniref:serine/threonine-protein kinase n=1 Tax=Dactylosporangium sp. NPDC005555 TaxID=3154889 RepID=UPI0033B2CDD3